MSEALFLNLKEMLGKRKKILIAGLGNANVTADSLGPKVVNNLCITRHLEREGIGEYQYELSAIAPGVMAQTGIETSEILESLAAKIRPDVLIAIDALAARSSSRLNKTIQISDTGISPDLFGRRSLEKEYENMDEEFISMHVTPKNIDESMKRISYTISEGINHLLHN